MQYFPHAGVIERTKCACAPIKPKRHTTREEREYVPPSLPLASFSSLRIFMRDGLSCYVFYFISRKNTFSKEVFDCLIPLLWLGPKA